jgi:uncharacterized surface protein with fasciclin (FAS1) repeats
MFSRKGYARILHPDKGAFMKKKLFAALAASTLVLAACGSDDSATESETVDTEMEMTEEETTESGVTDDIVTIASTTDGFSTLVAALEAADLVTTLQGEGPFTVFAPTDDAFAALPEGLLEKLLLPENVDVLTAILTYHVVSGAVYSTDIVDGDVATVEGSTVALVVSDMGVTVNGANVTMADIAASNGVIHVIDQVIVPPTVDVSSL